MTQPLTKSWRVVYQTPGGEAREWETMSLAHCREIIARYGEQMPSYAIQRLEGGAWIYWLD